MAIFIGIPLCNWLYAKLEPVLGRRSNKNASKTNA
jgi:hypothetical protein